MVLVRSLAMLGFLGAAALCRGGELALVHDGAKVDYNRRTASAPGPFSNLYFASRQIDSESVRQEHLWLLGEEIHLLQEIVSNSWGATALEQVPRDTWDRMQLDFEIIRNERRCFARFRHPTNWERFAEQAKTEVARRFGGSKESVKLHDSEQWHPTEGPENLLSRYVLTVDLDELKTNPLVVLEPGRAAAQQIDGAGRTNLLWEVRFDPVTGLKLAERRFSGERLVYESVCRTNIFIDPAQFQLSTADLRRIDEEYGPFRKVWRKMIGLGFSLRNTVGPFVVDRVWAGGPAEAAGLQQGDLVIGINATKADGMEAQKFADLAHHTVDRPVSIEVQIAGTARTNHFELKPGEFQYETTYRESAPD